MRQAFNYAVNKQDIVQLDGGPTFASPTDQILTSTITGYTKIDPYATPNSAGDPVKAKAMLAAAGYPNGLTCQFLYRDVSKGRIGIHHAPAGLREGRHHAQGRGSPQRRLLLQAPLQPDDPTTGTSRPRSGRPTGRATARGRSSCRCCPALRRPASRATTNYGCFDSTAFNTQINAALGSSTPGPLWAAVDKAVTEQAPWAPIVETNAVEIVSPRVKGYKWFNFADNGDIANMSVN